MIELLREGHTADRTRLADPPGGAYQRDAILVKAAGKEVER